MRRQVISAVPVEAVRRDPRRCLLDRWSRRGRRRKRRRGSRSSRRWRHRLDRLWGRLAGRGRCRCRRRRWRWGRDFVRGQDLAADGDEPVPIGDEVLDLEARELAFGSRPSLAVGRDPGRGVAWVGPARDCDDRETTGPGTDRPGHVPRRVRQVDNVPARPVPREPGNAVARRHDRARLFGHADHLGIGREIDGGRGPGSTVPRMPGGRGDLAPGREPVPHGDQAAVAIGGEAQDHETQVGRIERAGVGNGLPRRAVGRRPDGAGLAVAAHHQQAPALRHEVGPVVEVPGGRLGRRSEVDLPHAPRAGSGDRPVGDEQQEARHRDDDERQPERHGDRLANRQWPGRPLERRPVERWPVQRRQPDLRWLPGLCLATVPRPHLWLGPDRGARGFHVAQRSMGAGAEAAARPRRGRDHHLRVGSASARNLRAMRRSSRFGREWIVEATLDAGVAHQVTSTSYVSPLHPAARPLRASSSGSGCRRSRAKPGRATVVEACTIGRIRERANVQPADSTLLAPIAGRTRALAGGCRAA